ncbi:NAD-dependent deacylase [Kroppenstedtia pulmonis]|uniref:protein acetyllysine N-acetyltransferase n=1 Tax=Kroppenstedtia pulmonis TaxID=1380685 RepID=A0A7D3Y8E3_9BACL|nr:NAD-dependent deacylase [Kroppenstedtia pulmonis]QKG83541.1 NAD-dependent deacylase [Kroppenstedtia pulmonis]
MENESAVLELARWIDQSRRLMVLTGAGMSTESGVPDFRSQEGFWSQFDPVKVASSEAISENYPLFHRFYKERLEGLEGIKPHRGHEILATWEKRGTLNGIATQNVDQLHQQAGSHKVYELHGSLKRFCCQDCGEEAKEESFRTMEPCQSCGGRLRPGIVLFGERLPQEVWATAISKAEKADLILVIGTSLEVYPVNQFPYLTKGKVVVINAEVTDQHRGFDAVIQGKAGGILEQVEKEIQRLKEVSL